MLKYAAISYQGKREYNEDSIGYINTDSGHCFVLADGLGGHENGDVASRLVTEYIISQFKLHGSVNAEFIENTIEKAQDKILSEQQKYTPKSEMKSTCVVLVTDGKKAYWSNVGDSRLYYFSGDNYIQTEDHSVTWMLMKANEIDKDEIRYHEDRNRLIAALGSVWSKKPYKIGSVSSINCGDTFLLCSDGLWEHVVEEKMMRLLKKTKSPQKWLDKMGKIVERKGVFNNLDNYSAIAVWISKE